MNDGLERDESVRGNDPTASAPAKVMIILKRDFFSFGKLNTHFKMKEPGQKDVGAVEKVADENGKTSGMSNKEVSKSVAAVALEENRDEVKQPRKKKRIIGGLFCFFLSFLSLPGVSKVQNA